MTSNQEKETFSYTYSAKEQEEIEKIRRKYEEPKEDKMAQLRMLDSSVNKKATLKSISVGTLGALIMGSGMSLTMSDLNEAIGIGDTVALIAGIVVGVIGMALVGLAYPIFTRTLAKERKRIAPEVLRLTDELLK